jgi:NAD-dependent SIR2 family protein deacetylase
LQAHIAIAECEARLKEQGRKVVVITQNIDELHKKAGSQNILELHGQLCFCFVLLDTELCVWHASGVFLCLF